MPFLQQKTEPLLVFCAVRGGLGSCLLLGYLYLLCSATCCCIFASITAWCIVSGTWAWTAPQRSNFIPLINYDTKYYSSTWGCAWKFGTERFQKHQHSSTEPSCFKSRSRAKHHDNHKGQTVIRCIPWILLVTLLASLQPFGSSCFKMEWISCDLHPLVRYGKCENSWYIYPSSMD